MLEITSVTSHFLSILQLLPRYWGNICFEAGDDQKEIGRLASDAFYGLAAIVLLGAGLTLWFGGVSKPTFYYSKNWIFHLRSGALCTGWNTLNLSHGIFIKTKKR